MGRGLIVAACLSLAACGGGGGDEDGFGNGGPINTGSSGPIGGGGAPGGIGGGGGGGGGSLAPGFWVGFSVVDGVLTQNYMEALVTEEGDFYMTTQVGNEVVDFFGEDDGENENFQADNVTTYGDSAPRADSSIEGTVDPGVTFDGSITYANNTSATFELNFSERYNRSASLTKLQGVYSFSSGAGSLSIVVQLDGTLTATLSNGCTLTGDVTVPRADRNYYRITGEIESCGVDDGPMTGLIHLSDSSGVDQDDFLILVGETDSESTSIYLAGEK
jgi:hypothetical protein